jgi:hypothetical protein
MSYSNYQARLAPGFLQGPKGSAWQRILGAEKDVQLDMNRQAVLADQPGQAPSDALDRIGADRDLPRATSESDADYAERLRTAWTALDGHAFRGSHGAMLRALARAGFPTGRTAGAVIVQRTQLTSSLSGAPGSYVEDDVVHDGWTFNEQGPEIWNQFGIVFAAYVPGTGSGLGGTDAGALALAATLNNLVRLWKPAKARFMGTHVVMSGAAWGWPIGTATWGLAGRTWGGNHRFVPPV